MIEQVSGKRPLFEISVKALIPYCGVRGYNQWVYLFLRRDAAFNGNSRPQLDIPGGWLMRGDRSLLAGLGRGVHEETHLEIAQHTARKLAHQVVNQADRIPVFRNTYLVDARYPGPVTISGAHTGGPIFLTREDALEENLGPELREVLSRDELFRNESYTPSYFYTLVSGRVVDASVEIPPHY